MRDEMLTVCPGFSVESITVWTRDHNMKERDGEVSHSVCGKTEHPEYRRLTRYNNDISILQLCKPLMFTNGSLLSHVMNLILL